ncbi:4-hydroxy-2-oxovalerate aldolase [anaerobic digester metagenome]
MELLETTLRDGSYAIDFKFTAQDTGLIASELERCGFRLIEIGHGVGMGATARGKGDAAETDEDYLKAAAENLRTAKFGMFCIPGIATLDDVDMACANGAGFLRIGTNANEAEAARPFIERAKKQGLLVAANLMKSYTMSPELFAQKAKCCEEYGADILYVVDSAGGMLPRDLERYFLAAKEQLGIPLGFHGHNNLGLAVAHSLQALELGAEIVDCSLQGLGRSAGNAATETLVAVLERMGRNPGIDLLRVLDVGERYIQPLMRGRGVSSLDTVMGFAQFHSSYMGMIRKYAGKYRIDPRRLIIETCKVDRVNAPAELLDRLARALVDTMPRDAVTARFGLADYHGDEQSDMP